MTKPNYASSCVLSFALCLSLGGLAAQDPPAAGDKKPASTDKSSTRNRVVEPSGALLHPTDEKFVMDAARGGMMEVQLGQTAQQKASSAAVKEFGKRMEQDHTKAGTELAAIAKNKNVSLPTDVGAEKAMMDKLSNQTGAAFDKAYAKAMVRDHKSDVKDFERESAEGIDSDVKAFAAKMLPMIKEHLAAAEGLLKNPAK